MTDRTKEICSGLGIIIGLTIGKIICSKIGDHIQHKRFMSDIRNDIAYQREYGRLKD